MTDVADDATSGPVIGWIDAPASEGIVGPTVCIRGWALARAGVRAVRIRIGDHCVDARIGLPREDVAAVRPGYPDNPYGGFECIADCSDRPAGPGIDRRAITIAVIAADGTETTLGERTLIEPAVHTRWRGAGRANAMPFYLVPALSGVLQGAAFALDTRYAAYASSTTQVGMRVPILYLRTTTGRDDDYRFDAHFDVRRRHAGRAIADDALADVLDEAVARRLPVLVTLNGGIWSDAAGTASAWDLNDRLEEDPANCQWNERDAVMPDDHLKHLPGSLAAPELARALTLNVYAHDVRRYKRRNLQLAAAPLVRFMRQHPSLFIGVNLDPDVYINPFFEETQWYDYNPGTLRQFRHWLAGTGPYAGERDADVPDLSRYRPPRPLTLRDASRLARRAFATWDDVDPPRVFSREPSAPFWNDPWVHAWETFRRHLVALHYDELAQWLVEAGVPGTRIWSSQGLMAPADGCMPLALRIASPVKNYDSGGVSIEGSKPHGAHLGAIVYGNAAANAIPMEDGGALFETLAAFDPAFAIVEFNTADLRHPERHPTYAAAYRAWRDLWNAGARFASPMAWNGANGLDAARDDYVAYTAWRNTPFEEAARDFLLARCGLPLGSRLWTFGTQVHADDDGWYAEAGTLAAQRGAIALRADRVGRIALCSPRALRVTADVVDAVVLGLTENDGVVSVHIAGRGADHAEWHPLAQCRGDALQWTAAGARVPCARGEIGEIHQLRVELIAAPNETVRLTRVAVLVTLGSEQ
ncbi:MAG: hypothetical protein ACM34F_04545 [Betaproteobacteria bacterium]